MKRKALLISIVLILLCIAFGAGNGISAKASTQENERDFGGGKRLGEPEFVVANPADEEPLKIKMTCGKNEYDYVDEKVTPTNHLIAQEIYDRGIDLPAHEKVEVIKTRLAAGASYEYALTRSMPKIRAVVDRLIADNTVAPRDAELSFFPSRNPPFVLKKEKQGTGVDAEFAYRKITYEIFRAVAAGERSATVGIPQLKLEPEITADDLKPIVNLRSRFTTTFAASNKSRSNNIALAMNRLSGTRLNAGEEFSFNETVGKRTAEAGFQTARIIVGGEYVDGVGGGVCQASTTLYNAALEAGMKITDVQSHSLASSYVEPSFDAMVNSGSSDLKFINDGDAPVFIRAYATADGRAVVEFYGKPLPHRIKRESVVIKRGAVPPDKEVVDKEAKYIKEPLPAGTKVRVTYPHASVKSEGYLNYYDKSGRFIKREKIRSDSYNESVGIIAIAA